MKEYGLREKPMDVCVRMAYQHKATCSQLADKALELAARGATIKVLKDIKREYDAHVDAQTRYVIMSELKSNCNLTFCH